MSIILLEGTSGTLVGENTKAHIYPDRETAEQDFPKALHTSDLGVGDPIPLQLMLDGEQSTEAVALDFVRAVAKDSST